MDADDINELICKKPFQAFKVYFSDNTSIVIKHPETVSLGVNNFLHGTPIREGARILDHRNYYNYNQIVRIEELEPKEAQSV